MMCFDNTVLCFDNSLLCSDNTMLCLEKCLLCFKNCLLCLQIWATVLNCQTAKCPKFASGESQKLDKLLSSLLQIHKKREKMTIISRLRCLSTV